MTRPSRRRTPWHALAALFAFITLSMGVTAAVATTQPDPDPALVRAGQDVYGARCALCHGEGGLGQGEVPGIVGVGAAAIDFVIRTGRMPIEQIDEPIRHGPQILSDGDREALIAYIPTLGDERGPEIPDVSGWEEGDLARGLELFTSNCAACHGPTAAGIAVGQRDVSSNLDVATPLEIAEAIRIGPGVMPVFGEDQLDEEDLDAIIAWVVDLRAREAPGGAQIGRSGPVSEGFVAWIVGMGLLTVVMYLLGERSKDGDDLPEAADG